MNPIQSFFDEIEKVSSTIAHIFITGSPGAGKTTRSMELAKIKNMPVIHGDRVPPTKYKYPGTDSLIKYLEDVDKPHIVEGAQILGFSKSDIADREVVILDPDEEELIKRLVNRGWQNSYGIKLKGERDRDQAKILVEDFQDKLKRFRTRIS